jgi:ABC-type dipeptide/oligopeptide/nickel transport system permease component
VDPSVADSLREKYGLNESLGTQFLSWSWQVLQGDLGVSFQYGVPVTDLLANRLINTAVLVLPALVLGVGVGILAGALSAARGGRVDRIVRTTAYATKASPSFWVATMALLLFSYKLGWFPSIGMVSQSQTLEVGLTRFLTIDFLHHLVLPMLILAVYYSVEPLLTMRSAMTEILQQEFIELGHAQGLRRSRVILHHAARNGLLPVVSLAPVLIETVIGGQIITETVFSWPGMGRAVVEAVDNFDYPVMQGAFLLMAVSVVVVNTLVDVLYAYLDPRVRLS